MKTCPKCGEQFEEKVKFCPECGTATPIPAVDQPSLASEKTSFGKDLPEIDDPLSLASEKTTFGENQSEIDDLIGATVFSYKIEEKIGQGGMGSVYRAIHPEINKTVAIKYLSPAFSKSDKFIARFKREAQAMAELKHKNIVKIENMGEYKGKYFLIMEYIPGQTVAEIIQRQGRMEWQEAIHISEQVLQALKVAHSQGMLHRDIKPGNILVEDDGTVKIVDFGLVKIMGIGDDISINEARSRMSISVIPDAIQDGIALTMEGSPIGTFDYMSPEQYRGELDIDARSDIYSFGMTLYKMLTGKVARIRSKGPSRLHPEIPWDLDDICFICMEEGREGRYRNVDDVLKALGTVKGAADKAAKDTVEPNRQKEVERCRAEKDRKKLEIANSRQEEVRSGKKSEERKHQQEKEARKEREALRHREEQDKQPCDERERRKGGGIFRWVAALVVVLLVAGGFYYANQQEKDNHQVFEKAAKMMKTLDEHESVEPVNFRELFEFLPTEIEGFQGNTAQGITTDNLPGEAFAYSTVRRRYSNGRARKNLSISIIDTGYNNTIIRMKIGWYLNMEYDSAEGFLKTVWVDGYEGKMQWEDSGSGNLAVNVIDRFYVMISFEGFKEYSAIDELLKIVEIINFNGLKKLD